LEVRQKNRCCRATYFKDVPHWHGLREWTVYSWWLITWDLRTS
jgi:hypothetical protein